MILDRRIQRREVVVARATPPQPSSRDQAVENSLAERSESAGPRGPTTPSPVPSACELPRADTRCTRLKWMIISVNMANRPVNEDTLRLQ